MAKREESISVVIPTYKRLHLATALARNIRRQYQEIEIIIIDQENSSSLISSELKQLKVKYFNLPKANTSVAKNKGIKEATCDIIIFFDDDVEITNKTIAKHLDAYKDPEVAATSGRVIIDGEKLPLQTDVYTGRTNFLGTKFLMQFYSIKGQYIDFPYGCNMSFRKSALMHAGGFDIHFPKIFEEVDLGFRIKKLGKIKFIPDALVYHHKAISGGIRPEEHTNKQKLIFRNYGYYLAKNILFPFSLISLILRVKTALKISSSAVFALVKGYVKSFLINHLILLFFLAIATIRLWRVSDFFIFTFSEEWQGTLAWELVKNFHIIWIGVSQANINYYLGPGFIYLNYLLFLLGKGELAVLAYFSAFLGIATAICLYIVVRELFSQKIALLATIIYGFSTLINYYDRRFWNPSFVPIFSLLFIYSLIKANKNTRWLVLTAALFGASFHLHLLLMLFILPTAYVFAVNKKITRQTWGWMIAVYLTLTSPLIVFDLVHNFDNLLMPIKILFGIGKNNLYPVSVSNMTAHIQTLLSMFGRLWFVKLNTNLQNIALETNTTNIPGNMLLSALSLIALGWFFLKYRKTGYRVFFIYIITIITVFIIYPSYNPEYYLTGFMTIMAIVIAFWLRSLPAVFRYTIISIFITANVLTVITTTDDYGLTMRKRLVQKTMPVIGQKNFRLETAGPLENPHFAYAGWRMLYKAYGKTPAQSNVDTVLGWIYPDEIKKNRPELRLVIAEDIQPKFDQKPLYEFRSGVYHAYIFKNE